MVLGSGMTNMFLISATSNQVAKLAKPAPLATVSMALATILRSHGTKKIDKCDQKIFDVVLLGCVLPSRHPQSQFFLP